MTKDYILLGIISVVIIILLCGIKKYFFKKKSIPQQKSVKKTSGTFANCPICNSLLTPGINVQSKVFRNEKTNDQLCYVYGCSNCYPNALPNLKRICPVCKKKLPQEDYLISRIFYKTKSGRPHVIINGCLNCKK